MHCQLHPFLVLLFPRPADEQGFAKPPLPHPSPAAFLSLSHTHTHTHTHFIIALGAGSCWVFLVDYILISRNGVEGGSDLGGFQAATWVGHIGCLFLPSLCLVSRQAAVYSSSRGFFFLSVFFFFLSPSSSSAASLTIMVDSLVWGFFQGGNSKKDRQHHYRLMLHRFQKRRLH
ncbi:uncharacterized protein J3D65DRAFT_261940 [Phyllosticta citribraziliensis]|uniref:Uncharacterized protein n=1 Tax=Phyllosticta citribraziliensis TaxID=989973 RepID=A0ABR1M296_9PEZI